MNKQAVDLLIVGGGLIGAALMLALKEAGLSVLMVEAQAFQEKAEGFDARTLALSPASVRILQMLGLWPDLAIEATPIQNIHVSEQGRFAKVRLNGSAEKPLGFVLELSTIHRAMQAFLSKEKLLMSASLVALDAQKGLARLRMGSEERDISARLIVAADGAASAVRRLANINLKAKDYQQKAIVANLGLARPHEGQAFERFMAEGSLALLPMSAQRASLVWALNNAEADRLMALSDREFLKHLQKQLGYHLGPLKKIGERVAFTLQRLSMPNPSAWPLVFIGNAAQTLHPIAGQGFNLGLRDAAMLAQCVLKEGLDAKMLSHYQALRRYDRLSIHCLTDGLLQVFGKNFQKLSLFKALGMLAVDRFSGLQGLLTHAASGFAGHTPDLACGLPLDPSYVSV